LPIYRVYKLDANRIAEPSTLSECKSDAEIIAAAEAMLDPLDIEVWDGLRLVAKLTAD
jgi:hypothetical protein